MQPFNKRKDINTLTNITRFIGVDVKVLMFFYLYYGDKIFTSRNYLSEVLDRRQD